MAKLSFMDKSGTVRTAEILSTDGVGVMTCAPDSFERERGAGVLPLKRNVTVSPSGNLVSYLES